MNRVIFVSMFFMSTSISSMHEQDHELANRALLESALHHNLKAIRSLLARGADMNTRDAKGRTPLMLAAKRGEAYPTIKLLLQYGADHELMDNKQRSAIGYASRRYRRIAQGYLAFAHEFDERLNLIFNHTDPTIENILSDASAVIELLEDERSIREILLENDNPRLKRIKRDPEQNIFDAILDREFNVK